MKILIDNHISDYDKKRDEVFKSLNINLVRLRVYDLNSAEFVWSHISSSFGSNIILARSIDDLPESMRSMNEQVLYGSVLSDKPKKEHKLKSHSKYVLQNPFIVERKVSKSLRFKVRKKVS